MKILFAEDDKSDIDNFNSSLKVFERERQIKCEVQNVTSFNNLKELGNLDFDCAIIDIKLKDGNSSGNSIISFIKDNLLNIPMVIITGTPKGANEQQAAECCIKILKKGEAKYKEELDEFFEIYNTGITQIVGARGKLKELISDIYNGNIRKNMDTWKKYKKEGKDTHNILLRYFASNMQTLLEENLLAVPDEIFIPPLKPDFIKTGNIIRRKKDNKLFIVLNPECDLVLRKKKIKKTIEPDSFKTYVNTDKIIISQLKDTWEDFENKDTGTNNTDNAIKGLLGYIYYFPATTIFEKPYFINFRDLETVKYEEVLSLYDIYSQVSPSFMKEITHKFSSYYSRQGQPDFDFEEIKRLHYEKCTKK